MSKAPATAATRLLKERGVPVDVRLYDYVDHGGTGRAALELGVDEHVVIKTLVFEDEAKSPFLVLMHGDKEVSLKELAREIGAKSVAPCTPEAPSATQAIRSEEFRPWGPANDCRFMWKRASSPCPASW